jgi:predicted NBD/HSP70 family sugar kinase
VASARLRAWLPSGLSKPSARLAEALRMHGPSTRARLGEVSGLSRPTVSAALAELAERGFLESDTGDSARKLGRPAELFRLSRNAGLVVGVDIGRRHVQVVLTDLGHQELGKTPAQEDAYRHPPSADADPDRVLDHAARLVRTLLDRNGGTLEQVVAIGLGIPAPITHRGEVGSPTLLAGWKGTSPAQALAARLGGVPVLVDNDANLGALGEYLFGGFRAGHRTAGGHEMVYVKIATGIGAGIIRDGRICRGASGTAGELGHITLDYQDRQICLCGNHGCLELYAGGEALLSKARAGWPELVDTLDLVDRAKTGDPYCISVVKDAGDLIGTALGTLVNLNSPDQIVIGGELSDSGEILLGPVRERIRRTAIPPAAMAVTISEARLKKWSSAWGAAALVLTSTASGSGAAEARHRRLHSSWSLPGFHAGRSSLPRLCPMTFLTVTFPVSMAGSGLLAEHAVRQFWYTSGSSSWHGISAHADYIVSKESCWSYAVPSLAAPTGCQFHSRSGPH